MDKEDKTTGLVEFILPYEGGRTRIEASKTLLARVPWLPRALDAVAAVAGKWWPDGVQLLAEDEWDVAPNDVRLFVVPDWVYADSARHRKLKRTRRGRLMLWVLKPLYLSPGPDANGEAAYLLADALYQQLEDRELAITHLFGSDRFCDQVFEVFQERYPAKAPGRLRVLFVVVWYIAVVLPLFVGLLLYSTVAFLLLSVFLLVAPRHKKARRRYARLRRGLVLNWRLRHRVVEIWRDRKSAGSSASQ